MTGSHRDELRSSTHIGSSDPEDYLAPMQSRGAPAQTARINIEGLEGSATIGCR